MPQEALDSGQGTGNPRDKFSFSASFSGKDVNVKAPKDIFISSDGIDFSSDLLLSISKDETISVYVRYIPSTRSALIVNEKIRIYSDDDSVSVNVNAREGDPDLVSRDIYSFDFDIVNTNWTQYSVSSNNNWWYRTIWYYTLKKIIEKKIQSNNNNSFRKKKKKIFLKNS